MFGPGQDLGTLGRMFGHGDRPDGRPGLHRPAGPVSRPTARFGLSLETDGAPQRSPAGGAVAGGIAVLGASAGAAALYVWDDLLLAAPVIAVASLWGAFPAWALFSALYAGVSLVLALAVVAAHDRWTEGRPSRLAEWLHHQGERRRGMWGRRLIGGGQFLGFVLASFLLGGIVTTWMVRILRPDRPVLRTAVASCCIFGVAFTAQYAGIAALVL
jgi:hypothetical protein